MWVIRLLFNSCWITFRAWKRRELQTLIQIALKEQSGHKSLQQTESSCKWRPCWTLQELPGCKRILYVWSLISVSNTHDSSIWNVWCIPLDWILSIDFLVVLRCFQPPWSRREYLGFLVNYGSAVVKWPDTDYISFLLNMAHSPVLKAWQYIS